MQIVSFLWAGPFFIFNFYLFISVSELYCLPEPLAEVRGLLLRKLFLLNIFIVFLIGFFGNLITIATIINARRNHPQEFTIFSHSSTPILIHLGICDILYCVVGLPSFAVIFHTGYFPLPNAPSVNFPCRNVIVYTDFITLGNRWKIPSFHSFSLYRHIISGYGILFQKRKMFEWRSKPLCSLFIFVAWEVRQLPLTFMLQTIICTKVSPV